jgi:hypothetical protein
MRPDEAVVKASNAGDRDDEDVDGGVESVGLSDSLPPLSSFKKVGSRFGPLGCLVWSLGTLWASGTCGSRAGVPRAAAVFPQLTPALEFADLGADYGADAEENERGSTSVRWVSGSGTGLFVLPCGVFWASGTCGSCAGLPRAAAVFLWSVPDSGIRLSRCTWTPSLFTPYAVGGYGRWLLSFPSMAGCWLY